MNTVPTELLRTLVSVVDYRSFTKAAQSLGVTQPAVSAQIKRLQMLLGAEMFDKRAPGVTLTAKGELVVSYARRLLTINDRILHLAEPRSTEPPLQIGVPGDFGGTFLPGIFSSSLSRYPGLRFQVRADTSESLLRDLRQGHLDLAIALTEAHPLGARHLWPEELAWAHSEAFHLDKAQPIKLVGLGEGAIAHKLAMSTLNQAGLDYHVVYTTFSQSAVLAAVAAQLGIALLTARTVPMEFKLRGDVLPKAPNMWCGIYLREGIGREVIEELADTIAERLGPHSEADEPATASELDPMPAFALRAGGWS